MTDSFDTFRWEQLARRQKIWIAAAAVLLVFVLGAALFDSYRSRQEIRGFENAAIEAKRESEDALKKAAQIVTQVKIREEALAKVEVKRDDKSKEVERAKGRTDNARAEYDRAVRERLPNTPSSEQLCAELKSLGYPCQPR